MRFLLFFLLLSPGLSATTFHVGSTRNYVSPNALYLANVVQNGDTIEIEIEGSDEDAAMKAIVALIDDKFGEGQ